MVVEIISIVVFANLMGFFMMWMCGHEKNVESRTTREFQILNNESKDKN